MLAHVPQAETLRIRFYPIRQISFYSRLDGAGTKGRIHPIFTVSFAGTNGWHIHVRPVPKQLRRTVSESLTNYFFPLIARWLEEHASVSNTSGSYALSVLYEEGAEKFLRLEEYYSPEDRSSFSTWKGIPMELKSVEPVIAERKLVVVGTTQEVCVQLGAPREMNGGEYICPWRILGIGNEDIRFAAGVDAFQALQLAMPMIGVTLDSLCGTHSLRLSWLGEDGFWFPTKVLPYYGSEQDSTGKNK